MPNLIGDLTRMQENCHREVLENGSTDHMPMLYIRCEEGETIKFFYICRECISNYLLEHPEVLDAVIILRGEPNQKLRDYIRKTMKAQP